LRSKRDNFSGKNLLSVDIGEFSIKVVVGREEQGKLKIQKGFMAPTPKLSYEKGQITDQEAVSHALKLAVQNADVKNRMVACSIESADIISREIVLPETKEEEIEKMLQYEIQQYMPIELNEYVVQFKILESFQENSDQKVRVLVTAVPRELVKSYYEVVEAAGLEPMILDIQSNAIEKLICFRTTAKPSAACDSQAMVVLDLGYRHINIVVLEQGRYRFSRFLKQGVWNINQSIAQELDVSMETAENKRIELDQGGRGGLFNIGDLDESDNERDEIKRIVMRSIDQWVDDIERVFKYYTSRNTGNYIERVYIYGGVAEMEGLDRYLQEALNIPVERIEALSNGFDTSVLDGPLGNYVNALGTLIRR